MRPRSTSEAQRGPSYSVRMQVYKKEKKGEEMSESEGELELIANGAKPYSQLEKDGLGRILGGSRLGFQDLDVIQENLFARARSGRCCCG